MAWKRGREVGKGSTAAVSIATSGDFPGEILAVKSTEFSQSQFLQREMAILSTLSSPYIVGYKGFDLSEERSELYYNLFMEYIPGGTLADEIRRSGGRFDEQTIKAYTCQILRGVEFLHSNGVVHCDIKGSNILVTDENGPKLADFGCSKRPDSDPNGDVSISGTPVYMAPEAARGEAQGPEADIWAVGCTVIEMATGRPAWADYGSNPSRVMYRIGFEDKTPSFPSSLSDQGKDFLSKCLVRDPKQRWTSTELLNHPFVKKFQSFAKPSSNSPTSILDLDHRLWNLRDDESASQSGQTQVDLEDERMDELSSVSGRDSWGWDEDWIPVRSRSCPVNGISHFSEFGNGGCCEDEKVGDGGFVLGDFSCIDFGRWRCDPTVSSLIITS